MPTITTSPPAVDELDDLFNYDVPTDEAFRDFQPTMDNVPTLARSPAKIADLGIDEEIQVVKKRKPIAKLDESRLLSQAGIPKLRRITKERLKFKGKGHEYTNLARLLTLYQLWLDDLYPRAKFADGLAIIEKLGHSKRMQTMRREWIREGKPESKTDSPDAEGAPRIANAPSIEHDSHDAFSDAVIRKDLTSATTGTRVEAHTAIAKASKEESLFVSDHEADDQPPDDDLDALLAEDARNSASTDTAFMTAMPIPRPLRDEFEDEMEAMADLW